MGNITKDLNEQQQEAVKHIEGSLLVLAGAGSGKTKVLTSRIYNLVQNGVKPYEILAVTFTNKAAKEMKERLIPYLGEDVVKKMWVGTFHSICGRILRQDLSNYTSQEGNTWNNNYVIYDETDSIALIKSAIKKLNLDEKYFQAKVVKSTISQAKGKLLDSYSFSTLARDYRTQKIAEIYEIYEKLLLENNALDFDDMLLFCVRLLDDNKEVREKYFRRFKHILIDEFQDTNPTQYKLVKDLYTNDLEIEELKGRSLFVVGDVDQSIYSWRGADFRIILNFQSDFKNSKLIKLEQNYRSTQKILNAANALILNNTERLSKNLFSTKGEGEMIELYEASDESNEARYIAEEIYKSSRSNSLDDFAILYRTNAQSRPIEEALIAEGLPYKIIGGLKFYDRKEIKDIVAYLKLIYNIQDTQSLKRIINVPKRSIGATSIKKLDDISAESNLSIYEIIANIDNYKEFTPKAAQNLKDFYQLIENIKINSTKMSLPEYISYVLDESGYLKELKLEDSEEAETRIDNLQELVNVAKEFEPDEPENTLGEFLAQIALVSDIDSYVEDKASITLMTIHSAKGLEFKNVFLAGLEEGLFPHSRSAQDNTEMEEERRLMYVGITRAMQKLYLTHAKRRQMWGEYRYYNPSRFIEEIPANLIKSTYNSFSSDNYGSGTFKNAVNKIKNSGQSYSSFESNKSSDTSTSFGKNFIAPSKYKSNTEFSDIDNTKTTNTNNYSVKFTPKKSFAVKKNNEKTNDKLKVQEIINNSKIKELSIAKKKEEEEKNKPKVSVSTMFNLGDRVFHEKFGIGHIENIQKVASSTMYMIDFGTQGKKALDATYVKLKKF